MLRSTVNHKSLESYHRKETLRQRTITLGNGDLTRVPPASREGLVRRTRGGVAGSLVEAMSNLRP